MKQLKKHERDAEIWDDVNSAPGKDLPWGDTIPELLEFEKEYIKPLAAGNPRRYMLDYAFGKGEILKHLARYSTNTFGAEISMVAIDKFNCKGIPGPRALLPVYTPNDIEGFFSKDPDGKNLVEFELITSIGLFHHLNPQKQWDFMNQFKGLMPIGGTLVISGWDRRDNYFAGKSQMPSKTTPGNVYIINGVERRAENIGFEVANSCTYKFQEKQKYKMMRTMRFLTLTKIK